MKLYAKIFPYIATSFLLFLITLIIITLKVQQMPDVSLHCEPRDKDFIKLNDERLKRFQDALTFRTISRNSDDYNGDELNLFYNFIRKSFPILHNSSKVQHEVVNNYSLLYKIPGSNATLKPFMLCAHLDVVPIAESEEKWVVPPFSGRIIDGYIYGRGTIDDKNMVIAILEAVTFALEINFKFERSLYLAFGHDEEVGGYDGAKKIGQLLGSRNVELEYLLDEGTFIMNEALPKFLIDYPIALISTSEKGIMNVKLTVTTQGGHSSMPPPENSIAILSDAVRKLHENKHPIFFGLGSEKQFIQSITSHLPFAARLFAANFWLFRPLIAYGFCRKMPMEALCRTTTAITKFNSGIKDNVVAPEAVAIVNHRIHPADTVEKVLERDRRIINDDRVKLTVKRALEPSPISSSDEKSLGYHAIVHSIKQIFKEKMAIAPFTMIANTDTKHYYHLTKNIYRFSPTRLNSVDLKRFHGLNERISVKNYEETINFYFHIIANSQSNRISVVDLHDEF